MKADLSVIATMPSIPISNKKHGDALDAETWSDYLTPEQRVAAIADILATAALRIMKERHEREETS